MCCPHKMGLFILVLFIVLYVLIIIASIIVMFHYMTEIMGLAYDYSGFY